MSKSKLIPAVALVIMMIFLFACANEAAQPEVPEVPEASTGPLPSEVIITFDYERQTGSASNQWAVWIEDGSGHLLKTLYASAWTADGGYRTRPDSIALWVAKSGRDSMSQTEVEAVSGPTPSTGRVSYTWDLTDAGGETVPPGEYKYYIEGTLRWKNYVLYSGTILLSDGQSSVKDEAVEFFYEESDRHAALTADSPENRMIRNVTTHISNK